MDTFCGFTGIRITGVDVRIGGYKVEVLVCGLRIISEFNLVRKVGCLASAHESAGKCITGTSSRPRVHNFPLRCLMLLYNTRFSHNSISKMGWKVSHINPSLFKSMAQ